MPAATTMAASSSTALGALGSPAVNSHAPAAPATQTFNIAVLPGDGIGVDVTSAALRVLRAVEAFLADLANRTPDMGGRMTTEQMTDKVIASL